MVDSYCERKFQVPDNGNRGYLLESLITQRRAFSSEKCVSNTVGAIFQVYSVQVVVVVFFFIRELTLLRVNKAYRVQHATEGLHWKGLNSSVRVAFENFKQNCYKLCTLMQAARIMPCDSILRFI